MKLKLKIAILVCVFTLIIPITQILYSILNLEPTSDYIYLYYYFSLVIISWLIITPILLKLLDEAAKQCAMNEFKKENNDSDTV